MEVMTMRLVRTLTMARLISTTTMRAPGVIKRHNHHHHKLQMRVYVNIDPTFVHMRPLIYVQCGIEKILNGYVSYFHFVVFLEKSATYREASDQLLEPL